MADTPHEALLERELISFEIKQKLQEQNTLLVNLVNYGTNLIIRCVNVSEKIPENIVVLGVLLKNFVAMLDSMQILLSEGAVLGAAVQARAMWESSISIEWILKDKSLDRAKHYFVCYFCRRISNNKKIVGESEKRSKFISGLKEISDDLASTISHLEPMAQEDIDQIEKMLAGEDYRDINKAFAERERNLANKKGYLRELKWYEIKGIQSVRRLAKETGNIAFYDVLYNQFSEASHSTNVSAHVFFNKDKIELKPIRDLEEIHTMISVACSLSLHTYQVILAHYRKDELDNFRRKYISEWQKPFMNIPRFIVSAAKTKQA
jgi:hypothetical protein